MNLKMNKIEKENRIHSFALEFLERQQIVPNLYADQIIRSYKEGYHQAEKDLELTWEDIASINDIITEVLRECDDNILYDTEESFYREVLKRFQNLKK